jgi:hypothetical protein
MNQEMNTDNRIFKFAFLGALLFVAAFSFTLTNFSNIVMFKASSVVIASTLAIASVSLLYKAIKKDNDRLSQI